MIVDSLGNALDGARALPNAMVTAVDDRGNVIAMSLTGQRGEFSLQGLGSGSVQLQVRANPGQVEADATSAATRFLAGQRPGHQPRGRHPERAGEGLCELLL